MEQFIGRRSEQKRLQRALSSNAPELIAIYGRRRVGKTFLVRRFFDKKLRFECTGRNGDNLAQQLQNFTDEMNKAAGTPNLYRVPDTWPQALTQLSTWLTPQLAAGKTVIFFDEFPWIDSHKSGFLNAFEHWWNTWGTRQPNLLVVICGSAASWMIRKVINNTKGLHQRITDRIRMLPFTLAETEEYLQSRQVNLDRYQILQLYMAIGGIPQYLSHVLKGESATQAIDRICFTKDGILQGEFENLYRALFSDAGHHMEIVRVLAKNNDGMTRPEIIAATSLAQGGTASGHLEELIESGFVTAWPSFGKKVKDVIYKLSDEFTHFYLKYMEHNRTWGAGAWQSKSTGQSWKSWSGVAFERVCLKHVLNLKKALGIPAVQTEEYSWRHQPAQGQGAQIDLLIDRQDRVINVCEMKYSENEFTIEKIYAGELKIKLSAFKIATGTKKSLFLTMVTTFGVADNQYATSLVQNALTMDALFDE